MVADFIESNGVRVPVAAITALVDLASAASLADGRRLAVRARKLLGVAAGPMDPLVQALLSRVQLTAKLARQADTDGLTGIANRRAFMTALDRELARSLRSGSPVAVALLDMDDLKLINDGLGHSAGDEALVATAECCARTVRSGDLAARLGGDEFAILLPGVTLEQAQGTGERLRCAIEAMVGPCPLRVSVGVAQLDPDGASADALLVAADADLYRDKQARKQGPPSQRVA